MTINYDAQRLKEVYQQKAEYFHNLSAYLLTCQFLFTTFPEIDEEPFPPTKEAHKVFSDWFFSSYELKKFSEFEKIRIRD